MEDSQPPFNLLRLEKQKVVKAGSKKRLVGTTGILLCSGEDRAWNNVYYTSVKAS